MVTWKMCRKGTGDWKNVLIGVGAVILGAVHIGNNAIIGANAVVTMDVPEGKMAVGIPAVIK